MGPTQSAASGSETDPLSRTLSVAMKTLRQQSFATVGGIVLMDGVLGYLVAARSDFWGSKLIVIAGCGLVVWGSSTWRHFLGRALRWIMSFMGLMMWGARDNTAAGLLVLLALIAHPLMVIGLIVGEMRRLNLEKLRAVWENSPEQIAEVCSMYEESDEPAIGSVSLIATDPRSINVVHIETKDGRSWKYPTRAESDDVLDAAKFRAPHAKVFKVEE